MKKYIFTLMLLFAIANTYAQDKQHNTQQKNMAFETISPEKKFERNLAKNSFTIYTLGGLKPDNLNASRAFQEKYSVTYHDFGCLAPGNLEFYQKYNLLVYQHLSTKWGSEWETGIKDNAIGFYNWKQGR